VEADVNEDIDMSMNAFARRSVAALGCLAAFGCGSATGDATGPIPSPPTVTLTVSPASVTAPGDIDLVAAAYGANGVGLRRVEFYERVINVDANPRKIGEDADAPYELKRSILSDADNGTREFTAKAYDAAGQMGTSNSSTVVVSVAPTPLQVTASASHTRITTPGSIKFRISANKALSRAEVYSGTTKVADIVSPVTPYVVAVGVTAANNGTQNFTVKAYDLNNQAVESASMTVVVDIRWDFIRTIDGVHTNNLLLVATDGTRDVYLAGTTDTYDTFLIKHDADGNRLWIRTFGGPNHDYLSSVGVDASGRVFVTGYVFSPPPSLRSDCFLTLYDATGNILRTQLIHISDWETIVCYGASDALGNIYVGGNVADSIARTTDAFLVKYDASGSTLWTRQFGSAPGIWNDDILTSISVDPAGGVYVGGYTSGSFDGAAHGPRDMYVLKFDVDGNRLWSRQYGTAGLLTFGLQLAADPDGGVYFAGQTDDPINRYINPNALLVRYGADGELRWARTLDGGSGDAAYGVTADGRGVYLVGATTHTGSNDITEPCQGGGDSFLATLSRDGALLSVRLLGTPLNQFATGVTVATNGDLYVTALATDQATDVGIPVLARQRYVSP
jgi:hypothetical protein